MKLLSKILFYLGLRKEGRGRQGDRRKGGRRANDVQLLEVYYIEERIGKEAEKEDRLNKEIAILEERLSQLG